MKARMDSIPAEAYREQAHVRSYEIGRDGAMRPATLLRYLENLATSASAAVGFEPNWYVREGTAWVVRNMDLFIGQLPRFGDQLGMATWVAEFRRVQAIRDYAVWDLTTGALVARAEARWAYVDRARAVPLRLPDAMTTGMRTLGQFMPKRTLTAPQHNARPSETTFEHTAHEYEVDSQRHINNCAYVDWLWEAAYLAQQNADVSESSSFQPRYYSIEYIRPTLAGERMCVNTYLQPTAGRQLRFEQEMIHTSNGSVCLRAITTYLRPFSPIV